VKYFLILTQDKEESSTNSLSSPSYSMVYGNLVFDLLDVNALLLLTWVLAFFEDVVRRISRLLIKA
jgi:hypothetical protein